ncbi:bifunctional heptose 7-phosphate kinase/heptose 1-phosphate adenyltransferase [Flaviaesturariibacter amylovorans]|uniref:D-glycero-beta-D-manno-heptose-7-phosphate kinase n=1 Tax=Flaviaesturariibacter amylovorans TaxID=1084520 RepID=A0ABP8GLH9_9BACT
MPNYVELFRRFPSLKVGVVGDVMLDTYMWGHVERISPEAPVPVVSLDNKEYRIGGAGNVALNLHSLGAQSFVLSVTGDDEDALRLLQLFGSQGINTAYCIRSRDRITTNKTRIISRNQQMMRLDSEITRDLNRSDEDSLVDAFKRFLKEVRPDMVVLEDYNKGVLTEGVIQRVIALCKEAGVLTAVDPKRKNFFAYKGVDIFKPNLKEVKEALNLITADADKLQLQNIHYELYRHLKHGISFITLSEKGVFYQQGETAALLPSHLRNIADVSGAGDTVIAVAALVYAATRDVQQMAAIANIAGGLVCEVVGTAAIDGRELLRETERLLG